MLSRLVFASCYVYSPRGAQTVSERSRLLRTLLKGGDATFLLKYAWRVRERAVEDATFAGFFRSTSILVPVPGSAPRVNGRLWVAERLAAELVREGLGLMMWPGLQRIRAVRKSGTSPLGNRPTVDEHYRSLAVESSRPSTGQIVLVDDVVTKGRTLLAAATRIREAFPYAQIRAFAMLRTLGRIPDVEHLLEPCIGEIKWERGDARRTP